MRAVGKECAVGHTGPEDDLTQFKASAFDPAHDALIATDASGTTRARNAGLRPRHRGGDGALSRARGVRSG